MPERDFLESTFTNAAGEDFRVLHWPAEGSDVVFLVHHGLGEHIGRYQTFADALTELPMHMWGYDVRGHGRSVGKPGGVEALDQLVDDLVEMVPVCLEQTGAKQVVLFGHSMGGAVVTRYLTHRHLHDAIRASIVSAPPVKVDLNFKQRVKIASGRLLRSIAPGLTLANELDKTSISSVPAEVERYLSDPLVHDQIGVGLGISLVDEGPNIIANAHRVRIPILVYHGADDGIVPIEGSREFFRNVASDDKVMHEFAGARHEVHHDHPDAVAQLFTHISDFVQTRLSPSA